MKALETKRDEQGTRFFFAGSFSFFAEEWMKEKLLNMNKK